MITRRYVALVLACVLFCGGSLNARAGSGGTAEEATAMVQKAATLLTSAGKEKAYPVFDDAAGPYIDRDLYIFVIDFQGTVVSHGANKALIGKSIINLKDSQGLAFVQKMIEVAQTKGEGWVDYNWANPTTKKVEAKSSFVKRVGDVLVGVGIYKG
jgi:signal transduction histidine kinase